MVKAYMLAAEKDDWNQTSAEEKNKKYHENYGLGLGYDVDARNKFNSKEIKDECKEGGDDLVDWSMTLDFDDYIANYHSLATSLPSESNKRIVFS